MNPTLAFYIEVISVIFSLLYVFLLAREIIWCWLFGILSSLLSIALFFYAQLYSETILYLFYVIIGVYGWYVWAQKKEEKPIAITQWNLFTHLYILVIGFFAAMLLGWGMAQQGGKSPYIDASTTVFSFVASYMQAHKILSNWVFWIVINAVSVYLYSTRALDIYAALIVAYTALSIIGWIDWRRKIKMELI